MEDGDVVHVPLSWGKSKFNCTRTSPPPIKYFFVGFKCLFKNQTLRTCHKKTKHRKSSARNNVKKVDNNKAEVTKKSENNNTKTKGESKKHNKSPVGRYMIVFSVHKIIEIVF